MFIGETLPMKESELEQCVTKWCREWKVEDYDVVSKNCNHFSAAVVKELTGQELPGWINEAAVFAAKWRGNVSSENSTANSMIEAPTVEESDIRDSIQLQESCDSQEAEENPATVESMETSPRSRLSCMSLN